jgi:hypothetical protein
MSEDCYFEIIDDNGKRRMSAKCVSCCKDKEEGKFFWQGSKRGYGKYEVVCETCNKSIFDPNK